MRPNYFIALRINDPHTKCTIESIQRQISSRFPEIAAGAISDCRLHITLCTLKIENSSEAQNTVDAFQEFQSHIPRFYPTGEGPSLAFDGLDLFMDQDEEARVIFAKVEEGEHKDTFMAFCEHLFSYLREKGILEEDDREYTPHMTAFKTTRLNEEVDEANRKNKRATIQQRLRTYLFGELKLGKKFIGQQDFFTVELLSMTELSSDGYYVCLSSISFLEAAKGQPNSPGQSTEIKVHQGNGVKTEQTEKNRTPGQQKLKRTTNISIHEGGKDNTKESRWRDTRGHVIYYQETSPAEEEEVQVRDVHGSAALSYAALPARSRRQRRETRAASTEVGGKGSRSDDPQSGGGKLLEQKTDKPAPRALDPWSSSVEEGIQRIFEYGEGMRLARHRLPPGKSRPLASACGSLRDYRICFNGKGGRENAMPSTKEGGGSTLWLHGVVHALDQEQFSHLQQEQQMDGHYFHKQVRVKLYSGKLVSALMPVAVEIIQGSRHWEEQFVLSGQALLPPDRFLHPIRAAAEQWLLDEKYRHYLHQLPTCPYRERSAAYFNTVPTDEQPVLKFLAEQSQTHKAKIDNAVQHHSLVPQSSLKNQKHFSKQHLKKKEADNRNSKSRIQHQWMK